MKQVIVTVSPDGEVTIESTGYSGPSCSLATKALEQALGVATNDTKKPAYWQKEGVNQKVGG